ncbi:hypothetical protein TNCV_97221 [Trichonephila clavipes]|nr:hypothetical protein TNCV_97221 [Trichonephila clavipes]
MFSSQELLKTLRVGKRYKLNLSRAQTSSRWCGVCGSCLRSCEVFYTSNLETQEYDKDESKRRKLTCLFFHLTMDQNYEEILALDFRSQNSSLLRRGCEVTNNNSNAGT